MKKSAVISYILNGLLLTLAPLIYGTIETKLQEADKKVEHAQKTLEAVVTQFNSQVSFFYDAHGNYVKETKTQKTTIEVLKNKDEEKGQLIDKLKYERDSLKLRSEPELQKLKSVKIKQL